MPPTVFISYSWDSEQHKTWVRNFATRLQANGVQVRLDQWDASPGIDLPSFMETSVREADFVLLVCTPLFANRVNQAGGGAGYEKLIVTGEIFNGSPAPGKFVPILREGDPSGALPSYLKGRSFVDFRDDERFDSSLEELLRHVHKEPRFVKPPVGSKPSFQPEARSELRQVVVLCPRCGRQAGTSNRCFGGKEHEFSRFSGPANLLFCPRCGKQPGTSSPCFGGTDHTFSRFSGPANLLFCPRCGKQPGTSNPCFGGADHTFSQFSGAASLIYCPHCGRQPGTSNSCLGGTEHKFSQFSGPAGLIYCRRCGKQPGTSNPCLAGNVHEFSQY